MINLAHDLIEAAGVAAPIVLYLVASKRKTKKEQDERHTENQQKLDDLLTERKYLLPHDHPEKTGPLFAENIQRRKVNGK